MTKSVAVAFAVLVFIAVIVFVMSAPAQPPAVPASAELLATKNEVPGSEQKSAAHRTLAEQGRGDADRGRQLFTSNVCVKCHGLPGDGGDVGPDLKGVGNRHDRAGLITAVLDPSAALAPGYGTVSIVKNDDTEIEGDFVSESTNEVVLKEDGVERRIAKSAIKRLVRRSPMPNGLADRFTAQELADLISYLESLK